MTIHFEYTNNILLWYIVVYQILHFNYIYFHYECDLQYANVSKISHGCILFYMLEIYVLEICSINHIFLYIVCFINILYIFQYIVIYFISIWAAPSDQSDQRHQNRCVS